MRGTVPHLIDYLAASDLKNNNVHHSTCLEAKRDAIVGLGHRSPRIDEVLDPLCTVSWQDTLSDVCSDYLEFGNGYLEVVRDEEGTIWGLHHLSAMTVHVFVEENANIFHYEIVSPSQFVAQGTLRFARFGDKEDFLARNIVRDAGGRLEDISMTSEVIAFPRSSNRSRHYGYIDWAAAVPKMELESSVTQYEFDFFVNGGVPDGIFSVLKKEMDDADWNAIKAEFRQHVGLGNRRKIMLLNIGDPEVEIEFNRLAADNESEGRFKDFSDTLAMEIVSAHRVPPLLAGIQVPGKLGAANELSNAMMAFQTLAVSRSQKHFSRILAKTLGDDELNGSLGLTAAEFLGEDTDDMEPDSTNMQDPLAMKPKDHKGNGFRTILEEINMGEMDTMGRMRTSLAEAQFRGRDMSQGVAARGGEV